MQDPGPPPPPLIFFVVQPKFPGWSLVMEYSVYPAYLPEPTTNIVPNAPDDVAMTVGCALAFAAEASVPPARSDTDASPAARLTAETIRPANFAAAT